MERSLRAARVATFVYFVLGTLMGMWLVQIPAVEKRAGISHATLGSLLVLLGLGAFIGMRVVGRLADRLGTRLVVPASGVLCGASLVLPGLARGPWALAGALLVFGFGNGCLDVSMNAHAVHVEKAYNRRIMSAFHATFSVGGVIAFSPWIWTALAGWVVFGLGLSGCVPQLFSAAGHTDPAAAGANVSRVAGLGYLGMLAGPALIGWMTRLMGLNYTFLLPSLLLVVAAVTAGILRTGSERESEPEPEPGALPLNTFAATAGWNPHVR
jgi:predicted MFS family arabinose efflux permease